MKKDTIRWIIGLGVLLALYILIAFLVPFAHTATYWVSIAFTLTSFGVTAAAFYTAFIKNPDAKSRFYGFPIARIGVLYGVLQLVAGILFMALGAVVPVWAAVLVFAVLLGAAVLGLISAEAVVEEIRVQDVKLKKNVSFMRGLQSKVNQMASQCDNPDAAAAVRSFAEDLRYSDPVSSEAIAEIEADLRVAVDELQAAVVDGDSNAVKQLCRKAALLLAERNRLCKLHKQDENPVVPTITVEKEVVHSNTPKIVAIAALSLCAIFVLILLLNVMILPNIRYSKAVKLIEKGRIVEAYDALTAMDNYKDSAEKAASIYDRYKLEKLKTAAVGDCVLFGSYDQDGDASNGKEDVQWLVLEKEEDRLLLISKFGLVAQPYNEFSVDVTWEESSLRKWLNNGFINAAFSELERSHIPSVTVSAEQNPLYETAPGADTEDQVFLLSIEEVSQYFSMREERACQLAGSACSWWLRNPGQSQTFAAVIDPNGDVDENGMAVDSKSVVIRPAIWVDLQK